MTKGRISTKGRPGIWWGKITILFLFLFNFTLDASAQSPTLDVGLRLQKTVNLYYENGFTVHYNSERFFSPNFFIGASYFSSRLGSAMGTNAIKQDNYLISSTYFLRHGRTVRPFLRMNAGYFYADYEEEIFSDLPNSSALLSPEAGIGIWTNSPFKFGASVGYNVLTGNGVKGPGTLYPLFIQTSLTWNILNSRQNESL